jgi:hypothetical protein
MVSQDNSAEIFWFMCGMARPSFFKFHGRDHEEKNLWPAPGAELRPAHSRYVVKDRSTRKAVLIGSIFKRLITDWYFPGLQKSSGGTLT